MRRLSWVLALLPLSANAQHPTLQWYQNPSWFAFALSIVSLVVSVLAYSLGRRGNKSRIQQQLISEASAINESILRHNVTGPYAVYLKIPPDRVHEFTAKAVVLFHQINLLRDVFENQDILGKDVVSAYEGWATVIVRPWIESDAELLQTWKTVYASGDLLGRSDFIDWIRRLFPIAE